MAQIPSVADGLLQGTAARAAGLAVGSPAWFAWLGDDAARSFSFRSPAGAYTARKERRQRGGAYWVAYRTAAGRQHKVYLGKAEDLTPERLAEVAAALAGRVAEAPATVSDSTTGRERVAWPDGPERCGCPCWRPSCSCPGPAPTWSRGPGCWPASTPASTRPVHAAVGAGRGRQDQPAGRLARPAGSPGRLARPRRARPGRRPGSPLPGRRPADDRSGLRPRGDGLARRAAAAAARGRAHRPGQRPGRPARARRCWSWTTTTSSTRPAVHAAVAFLLDHLPPALHLVIASREDPPLPLPRLRARGQLAELRAADLRFSAEEAAAFLGAGMGLRLAEDAGGGAGRAHRGLGGRAAAGRAGAARPARPGGVRGRLRRRPPARGRLPGEPRCWTASRPDSALPAGDLRARPAVRPAVRRPAVPPAAPATARRSWRSWSGPTCSWCRWTTSGAGTATTTCSPTPCAPGWPGRPAPRRRPPSTGGPAPGSAGKGCCRKRSATRWPATPPRTRRPGSRP